MSEGSTPEVGRIGERLTGKVLLSDEATVGKSDERESP